MIGNGNAVTVLRSHRELPVGERRGFTNIGYYPRELRTKRSTEQVGFDG